LRDAAVMVWKTVLGWVLVSCGVGGTLYALWGAYAAYIIRSLLPFTQWDPAGVIGSIAALVVVSIAAVAFGMRLVRRSSRA
jgi:hypothetical protein